MKVLCVLACLAVAANALPMERTFHLSKEVEPPVEAAPEGAVEADALRVSKEIAVNGVTVKKVVKTKALLHDHGHAHDHALKDHVHEHALAHAALAHDLAHDHAHPHHEHAHVHASTTPAPALAPANAYGAPKVYAPAAPLNVVFDRYPLKINDSTVNVILQKLLSGAISDLPPYPKPLVVPPKGERVAVIFTGAVHVVQLGTLKTLLSAHITDKSYGAPKVKIATVKLPASHVPAAAAPVKYALKPVVAKPAYAAAPVTTPKYVAPAYAAEEATEPTYEAPAAPPVAPAPKYAAPALPAAVKTPSYAAPAAPLAAAKKALKYALPAYKAAVVKAPGYKAPAAPKVVAAVPSYAKPALPVEEVAAPSYAPAAEVAEPVVETAPSKADY